MGAICAPVLLALVAYWRWVTKCVNGMVSTRHQHGAPDPPGALGLASWRPAPRDDCDSSSMDCKFEVNCTSSDFWIEYDPGNRLEISAICACSCFSSTGFRGSNKRRTLRPANTSSSVSSQGNMLQGMMHKMEPAINFVDLQSPRGMFSQQYQQSTSTPSTVR
jgi:hypothetical protein